MMNPPTRCARTSSQPYRNQRYTVWKWTCWDCTHSPKLIVTQY